MSDGLDHLTPDDAAAIDRYVAELLRDEQDEINRKQGQFLLDVMAAEDRRKQAGNPLIEAINRAHQAQASEAEADKE